MSLTLSDELIPEAVAKGPPVTHRVSTTVSYDSGFTLDGVIVLLDTTGSGTLSDIHVAANLPCTGPTAGAGNDAPNVFIIAGVAGVTIPSAPLALIISASEDTGFIGPSGTCVFHGTLSALAPGTVTDIVMLPAGPPVALPPGTTVTITATYN